ncbi:hypothetical protein C4J65_35740 [Streptomyces sp. CB09001]|uniref:hypothetical protein n=1 Tax=unclassified Streptomyces TaxID=2593676 RepID=UPI000E219701|nr:hypothetical protein [Streptomyces sp. CB09001]AXL93024.1 hypothetical protein C4J65_35740 [Streptomyces sp. CB09001]
MSVEDFGNGGLGGFLVDEGLAGGEGDDEGLQAEVVDRAGGKPRNVVSMRVAASSVKSWSLRPASPRWCLM